MTVKADHVLGENRVFETPAGLEIRRSFRVDQLNNPSGSARILDAHQAVGVPPYGMPHPDEPTLFVLDKRTEILTEDPTVGIVTCIYRVPQPGEMGGLGGAADGLWEMEAAVTSEGTNTDRDGNEMVARYSGNPQNLPPGIHTTKWERFEISALRPRQALRFHRTETGMPDQLSRVHCGTINQFAVWANPAYPANTLLLTAIRSTQVDFNKNRYRVTYEFAYDENLWTYTGRVTINGSVPDDAVLGNGVEVYEPYPETDFSLLNIPSPN